MRTMHRKTPIPFPKRYEELFTTRYFPLLLRYAMEVRCIDVQFFCAFATAHAAFVTTDVPNGKDPTIAIYCEKMIGNVLDVDTTIFLAHELGHHESWSRGDTSDALEDLMTFRPAVVYDTPAHVERSMREEVYAEEERAWKYGREILNAVIPDFCAFVRFDELTEENLLGYREGLLLT